VECAEEIADDVAGKVKDAMNKAGAVLLKKVPTEVEVGISREWRK
jgi:DNA polymerase I-like protein with 3'-5' exonuclease and polymerase domains